MLTDIHIRSASSICGADPGLAVLAQGGRPLPGSAHVRLGFSLTRPLGSVFCCAQDEGLSLNITSPGPRCTLQATRGRSGLTLSVSPDSSSSSLGAPWVFLLVKSLSMWLVPCSGFHYWDWYSSLPPGPAACLYSVQRWALLRQPPQATLSSSAGACALPPFSQRPPSKLH